MRKDTTMEPMAAIAVMIKIGFLLLQMNWIKPIRSSCKFICVISICPREVMIFAASYDNNSENQKIFDLGLT